MGCKMKAEQFTVRLAGPDEDPAIAALVVEGFLDKFRPVFGRRMDRSVKIMERWIRLEHASGGVTSLVIEGYSASEIAGSVGIRTADSREDVLARGLWRTLERNLGLPRAVWDDPALLPPLLHDLLRGLHRAPRRLPGFPAPGHGPTPARGGRGSRPRCRQEDRRPPRQRQQPARAPALRGRRVRRSLPAEVLPDRLLPEHQVLAVPEKRTLARSSRDIARVMAVAPPRFARSEEALQARRGRVLQRIRLGAVHGSGNRRALRANQTDPPAAGV